MLRANQKEEETTGLMVAPTVNDSEGGTIKLNTHEDLYRLQLAIDLLKGKIPPNKSKWGAFAGGSVGVGVLCVDVYGFFVAPSGKSEATLKQYTQTILHMLNETIHALAEEETCGELYPVNNVCHLKDNTTIDPTCFYKAKRLCDRVQEVRPWYYLLLSIGLISSVALILYSIAKLCRDKSKKVSEVLSTDESIILSDALNIININLSANATVDNTLKALEKENNALRKSKRRSLGILFSDTQAPVQQQGYGSIVDQDSVVTLRK